MPDDFLFRAPWQRTSQPLHEELARETSPPHPLHGVAARAVARRQDNDDVLFELYASNAPADFAVVHLTWSGHPDQFPEFPGTELYPTFTAWVAERMAPDVEDWEITASPD